MALGDVALHVLIYLELPLRQILRCQREKGICSDTQTETQDSSAASALNTKGTVVRFVRQLKLKVARRRPPDHGSPAGNVPDEVRGGHVESS